MASPSAATPLASLEEITTWTTISDGRTHYGISLELWKPLAAALGEEGLDDLCVLASVDDDDYKEARDAQRMSAIKKGTMNRLFCSIKEKYGIATSIIMKTREGGHVDLTAGPPTVTEVSNQPQSKSCEGSMLSVPLVAKVKLGHIVNQGIDQEIPMLSPEMLSKARDRYIQACGDEPLASCAASDAQLTALNFLIENGMVPYADFALFNPYGTRVERKLKFVQHFMNAEGQWRTAEVPGPSTLDQWKACWEVYTVAAISLDIATPATLARYAKRFEERCARYPLSWHICARAEDRCRSEWMSAEKRRQERFDAEHPHFATIDKGKPWNSVIREAADSMDYWNQELQEPALLYATTRAAQAPSYVRQQAEQQAEAPHPISFKGKGKGKGRNKSKTEPTKHPWRVGVYWRTNEKGEAICVSYNKGWCSSEDCKRAHQCSSCLGHHPHFQCGQGGSKKRKTHAGSSSSSAARE